jgi:hypothetical protein
MKITRKQLNQLIESYLNEDAITGIDWSYLGTQAKKAAKDTTKLFQAGFQPDTEDRTKKVFYPTLLKVGDKILSAGFLGGTRAKGYYIVLDDASKAEFQSATASDKTNMTIVNSSKKRYIKSYIKDNGNTPPQDTSLNELIADQKILFLAGKAADKLIEPQAPGENSLSLAAEFMKTSGIEAGAAIAGIGAAAAAVAGLAPLAAALEGIGNTFNVADFFVKLDQKNYLGAVFAALGLVPGGDTIGVLKKLGKLDDVFPASLADDLAREIIKLIEGDTANTLTELVNAYAEDRKIDQDAINPFITTSMNGLKVAGRKLAASLQKQSKRGDVSLAT